MVITFTDRKLQALANDDRKRVRELGAARAAKLQQRLDQLRAATTLEDLRFAAGRFHELREDRKGQWACDLDQPYRLIFEPHEQPIPTNAAGQYLWVEIKAVEVVEIVNYHKEK